MCRRFILACGIIFGVSLPVTLTGQVNRPQPTPAVTQQPDASETINQLVTELVLQHMPHSYTRKKGWGKQTERWDGIKWERDGLRLKTKRRKKLVNHGTWRKYTAELIDPSQRFDITLTNLHRTEKHELAFRLNFRAGLKLHARQAKWVKGVQMYSLSANGQAQVRLSVDMVLGISLDTSDFPPGVIFNPRATSADIIVDDFRIDRISKLGGEFAQQVTRLARREMDQEIAEKEAELVEKINKEISENSDDLQLSIGEALDSKWADQALPFLPKEVQDAATTNQK